MTDTALLAQSCSSDSPGAPPPGLRERKCEAIAFVLAQMAEGARGRSPPPVCSQKARSGPGEAAKTDQQSTGAHSEWTARDSPAPGWHALAAPGHHRRDHPVVKRRSARLPVASRARAAITRADLNPERTFGPTARSARLPVSCRARAAITRADLNRSARSARLPVSSRARAAITRADLNPERTFGPTARLFPRQGCDHPGRRQTADGRTPQPVRIGRRPLGLGVLESCRPLFGATRIPTST